jgi:group I intron endonuclease
MENYKIYKISNKINGHFYIGYTKLTLEKRLKLHTKSKTNKMPIVLAIKKHGIENFTIELLFEFDNKKNATECEINLIQEMKPDYNIHRGGTGGAMYGPMNGMYGKKHTKEWLKNKSKSMTCANNPMFNKTHTDEIKEFLRLLALGREPWNKGKTEIYSKETLEKLKKPKSQEHKNKLKKEFKFKSPTGEYINVFGLTDFCKNNNLNKGAMSDIHNGKRNCYKGWSK